jgi:hypothetical protein
MSVVSKAGVFPKAVIAAVVGTVVGGIAAVWSLRQPSARAKLSASPVAVSSPSTSQPNDASTEPTRARGNAAPLSADDDAQVLQHARTLARRPDVTALLALRDDVVRRATERGIAGSSSVKSELDEIDLCLNEARILQLKLDAEELRKTDSKSTR